MEKMTNLATKQKKTFVFDDGNCLGEEFKNFAETVDRSWRILSNLFLSADGSHTNRLYNGVLEVFKLLSASNYKVRTSLSDSETPKKGNLIGFDTGAAAILATMSRLSCQFWSSLK